MSVSGRARLSNRVMNLGDLLTEAARRFPARPAVIHGDRTWSWAEMNARVDGFANSLAKLGIGPGDKVIIHARNSHEMFETMFAVFKLGAVWVPTNFRILPSDVAHIAEASGARAIIYDAEFADQADAARDAGADLVICFDKPRDGEQSHADLVRAGHGADFNAAPVDRDDPCWFFFTSGSTGKPKAAVLSHGQMAFVINNHLADLMPGMTENDVSLVVAPLSHGAGIHQLIQVARAVPSVLTTARSLDASEVFRLIETHQVTNIFTVPSILTALVSDPAVDRHDHASLRYVIYAGAPMLREHQKAALGKLGPCLVQYFGLGEVTGNITVLPPRLHALQDGPGVRIGTCGVTRTGMQIEIQDDAGQALPPFENGEICVIGPAVFNGYYRNRAANEAAFRDGWFRTGDIGHFDDAGYLYITGRASDMFISGGSNIYPLEIEDKLVACPSVVEACVVGMEDEKWGEVGVAALVLAPGADLDVAALKTALSGSLAGYKIPKRFEVFDALPKSGYGKVTKALVREALRRRMADNAGTTTREAAQ
ncbi:acyl-CoA synthetase [Stappia stellulata]|uniref:acyl-CoA synthetase n=1 Tax=Stappia stellulata TaxID=71235 RepID=UPI00041189C0|nr:acyl-CoA synthetase [Stappia stellulata]